MFLCHLIAQSLCGREAGTVEGLNDPHHLPAANFTTERSSVFIAWVAFSGVLSSST